MPSLQLNEELSTLHSQERLTGELNITVSDTDTARSGEIVWEAPQGDRRTRTGSGVIQFDALDTIRSLQLPARNTPSLSGGAAPSVSLDTTFRGGLQFQGYQIAVNRTTGAVTTTALEIAQAEVLDSLWPLSRVNVSGGTALTSRGLVTTLPRNTNVPHLFPYFLPQGVPNITASVIVRAAPSPPASSNLTLVPGLNVIKLPYYTMPRDVEVFEPGGNSSIVTLNDPVTQVQITIAGRTWLFNYDCDQNEIMICKERAGGFLLLGFDRIIGQPVSGLPALQRTFPARTANYSRPPTNPNDRVPGRTLSLLRQHILGPERQTFAAFMDGHAFWYYDRAEARLKPCTLTSGTAIDIEETKAAEISIELYVD